MSFSINILPSQEPRFPLEVESNLKVSDLKEQLASRLNIPLENIRLIHTGRILKNDDTIDSCKITPGSTIHVVRMGGVSKKTESTTQQGGQPSAAAIPSSTNPAESGQPTTIPAAALRQTFQQQQMHANPLYGAIPNIPPEQLHMASEMLASNPQLMQTILQSDPRFRNLPPHIQQMMLSPEMLRMAMSAATSMPELQGGQALGQEPGNETQSPPSPAELEQMRAIATVMSQSNQPSTSNTSEPPERRFQTQLSQLSDMGFWDAEENIRALLLTGGNVAAAIEHLLRTPPRQ